MLARKIEPLEPAGPQTPGPADVPAIERLLRSRAPGCIPLEAETIRRHLHRFAVYRHGDRIVATASLRPIDLMRFELRSLAVDEQWSGRGLGTRLVSWAVEQAELLGKALVCVTREREFFEARGFHGIPEEAIPPKASADVSAPGTRTAMQYEARGILEGGETWTGEEVEHPRAGHVSTREMFCRCPV